MEHPALQNDNAHTHRSAKATAEVHCCGFTVLCHHLYSPDVGLLDFLFLSHTERTTEEDFRFLSDRGVRTAVTLQFCHQSARFYCDRLMKVLECWTKHVNHM